MFLSNAAPHEVKLYQDRLNEESRIEQNTLMLDISEF